MLNRSRSVQVEMASNVERSNSSLVPTAPPLQVIRPGHYENDPHQYQSFSMDPHRSPTPAPQYPNDPKARGTRNTLNRSVAFAGASIGHFFGVHDDPTSRGYRRTGTYRQNHRANYSALPYVDGHTRQRAEVETPAQPQENRFLSSLSRAGRTIRRMVKKEPNRDEVLQSLPKFWPVVTVLIALVEVGMLIAVMVSLGIAPIKFEPETVSRSVLGFNNQTEFLTREIQSNFFIGPSRGSLVHSGAMYTPCIRDNREFQLQAARISFDESTLRCCSSSPTRQCGMLPQQICVATYGGKVLGGASRCRAEFNNATEDCEPGGVVLHPCCVGLLGQCTITTHENCTFQDGYWHEDKILCSEVDCFADACRFEWINRTIGEIPDQGLRFVSAMFLNYGVVTLVIIGVLKFYNSWKIERRIGFLRFICIYFISGVGGFLLSGIFDPTHVSVGGSGPLFGLLGVLLVELIQGWKWVKRPCLELFKLAILTVLLLAIGTLPYVDNFSQIGGFIFGVIASFIFVPYITLGKWDRAKKICLIFIALPIILVLFLFGFVIFYYNSDPNFCPECSYINCIPYTETFCEEFITTLLNL